MSSDVFGFPVSEIALGKPALLSGQGDIHGAMPRMPQYMAWARVDALAMTAAAHVYLPFVLPPLPPGSVIRARAAVLFPTDGAATAQLGLGTFSDIGGTGILAQSAILTSGGSSVSVSNGDASLHVFVRGRASYLGLSSVVTDITQKGRTDTAGAIDFGRSQRWAVYGSNAGTNPQILSAFVEVFIPRIYR